MDEFFNFEEATNPNLTLGRLSGITSALDPSAVVNDTDLLQVQAANSESIYTNFQPTVAHIPSNTAQYGAGHASNVQMGGAQDLGDYGPSFGSREQFPEPCVNCRSQKLKCVRISTSPLVQDWTCTNCIAISQNCSLSVDVTGNYSELIIPFRPLTANDTSRSVEQPSITEQDRFQKESSFTNASIPQEPTWRLKDEGNKNIGLLGARFSKETVRVLRNWLSLHHTHPYPTEDEKGYLQQRTGLTKVQITNWLANARRRGQVRPPRARSPMSLMPSQPRTITKKPSNTLQSMDPMQRWEQSPAENEPASAADIARAIKTSSNVSSNNNSPFSYPRSDDGSARPITRTSSTNSRNSSHSSRASIGSGLSLHSRGSFGSFGQRGRRRRRPAGKASTNRTMTAPRQYQCTFCIETFKTKHDWQRHEKSLHLSLERWVCAPHVNKPTSTFHQCPFCAVQNPDAAHYEIHNYTVCRERSLGERTFYRKDHLRQHLRLVHECQFIPSIMDSWKMPTPGVLSRCGFCGIVMKTWAARIDHLAEHFKAGKSMGDWKGSWGFDHDIQKLVENGTPPHLINFKRTAAISEAVNSATKVELFSPYIHVNAHLLEFVGKQANLGNGLTGDDLRAEAAKFMLEYRNSVDPTHSIKSWFADLIMYPDDSIWPEASQLKVVSQADQQDQARISTASTGDIDGKDEVQKYCELERQMADFVSTQRSLGLLPSDADLRGAGCRILMEHDRLRNTAHSAPIFKWFCEQIMTSNRWINRFRESMGLPPSTESSDENIHTSLSLEAKLANFVNAQVALGIMPSDLEIQRQARLIIYEIDDPFLQTAADNEFWISQFKCSLGLTNEDGSLRQAVSGSSAQQTHSKASFTASDSNLNNPVQSNHPMRPVHDQKIYAVQNAKHYRRLELDLSRFVASCISEHSPNPHIPSDDEIRRQARWLVYNDNSPWNQTIVDNEEWLLRFKRSNGLAPP